MTTTDASITQSKTAHRTPRNSTSVEAGANASPRTDARARLADQTAHTDRDRPWWTRLLDELTPPTVWTDKPASLKELTLYARHAPWTAKDGFWRAAGTWWCGLIGIPVSTAAYYTAWTAQRPSRALTVLLAYIVLAHTGLGAWLLPYPDWLP